MSNATDFLNENGWPQLLRRASVGAARRVRDRALARHLRAPGFRAGRAPRLLGLGHLALGEDFHAGDDLWLEAVVRYGEQRATPELVIGPHARLSDRVHIGCLQQIRIGEHLLCGSGVLISDHAHGRYDESTVASDPAQPPAERVLHSVAPIVIGANVWLGDGVVVLGGASIGDGAVLGANAVVTGPIPAATVAVGAPARPVRQWDPVTRSWQPMR